MLRVCENVLLVVRSVAGPSTTFIYGLRLVLPSEDFTSTFVFSVGPTAFSMFFIFFLLLILFVVYLFGDLCLSLYAICICVSVDVYWKSESFSNN